MKRGDIKPWSQLDDDVDELGVAVAGLNEARRTTTEQQSVATGPTPSSKLIGRMGWLKVTPTWALAPLALAAVWILYGIFRPLSEPAAFATGQAVGILSLILAAAATLAAATYLRRAALAGVREAVRQSGDRLPAKLAGLPIASELQPLYEAMEQHTANIQRRVTSLMDDHRRLSLELSLAEVGKRQAEAITEAIAEPVIVTDQYDQLILANPAAEAVFHFSRAQAVRRPISDLIHDDKLVRIIKQAREADLRAANRAAECETESQTYSVKLSPLSSDNAQGDGTAGGHGVVAIFRNVTKEREAARNKSEFVAHASHELRTPLSSIRAYVEMLVDGEAADEKTRREYYDIIQASADRLGRMIDNILNISRIEAGTVRINKEPVPISMIVKEAVDVARPQAEKKKITLTEDLTPVVYRVLADRDLMSQAVLNLLSNAIKYTPEGGKVQVRMTPQEENRVIRIEVSDTGVGIPKEDLPRMFTKFFRVEANQKMAKGTGLGLNLVKHIVETIHEGKMTLTSEVNKGSAFGMNLPLMT